MLVARWRGPRRRGRRGGALSVTTAGGIDRLVDRVAGDRPAAVDADVDLESGDITPQASEEGLGVAAGGCAATSGARCSTAAATRWCAPGPTWLKPRSHKDLAKKYPACSSWTGRTPLTLYKNLEKVKTYTWRSAPSASRRPPACTTSRTRRSTRPGRCRNSDWVAPADRGKVVPPGPANPLKARWLGIFDGAGIHGTDADGLDRHRRVARLRPDADPRRDRALRPGPGRGADLHRLARRRDPTRGSPRRRPPATPVAAGRRDGRCGEGPGCR